MQDNKIFVGAGIAALAVVAFVGGLWTAKNIEAVNTQLTLQVDPGNITISGPDAIDFGTVTTQATQQTKDYTLVGDGSASEEFDVRDYKLSTAGYRTYLATTVFTGTNASGAVVQVLPVSSTLSIDPLTDKPLLRTGVSNDPLTVMQIPKTVFTQLSDTPVEYISRTGYVAAPSEYYNGPTLRLTLPGYIAVADYAGVLFYTLLEL